LEITMPAGANGKLYGAVTSQTVDDELVKHGHQIERKRIEVAAGATIKTVGKYKVLVKLYESAAAEITINVLGQEIRTESKSAARAPKRRRDENQTDEQAAAEQPSAESADTAAAASVETDSTPAESQAEVSASNSAESSSGEEQETVINQ
jgi:large subunit ribosomal protein L9